MTVLMEKQTCMVCGRTERVGVELREGEHKARRGWKVPVEGECQECGCSIVRCVMEDPGGLLVALDREGEGTWR